MTLGEHNFFVVERLQRFLVHALTAVTIEYRLFG